MRRGAPGNALRAPNESSVVSGIFDPRVWRKQGWRSVAPV